VLTLAEPIGCTFCKGETWITMDHSESVRKFEQLMLKQADHVHDGGE
jgi:hypothetical protein